MGVGLLRLVQPKNKKRQRNLGNAGGQSAFFLNRGVIEATNESPALRHSIEHGEVLDTFLLPTENELLMN